MKKIFITAAFCTGFLLAGKNAGAQSNTAPSAKVSMLKKEELKQPEIPALKKSTTTAPEQTTPVTAPATADITKDANAVEIKADMQKGLKPQNVDRPKTSTIEPVKNVAPSAKPTPQLAPVIEGD